jgi:glutamate synthase (NADPH/NADH) small chain
MSTPTSPKKLDLERREMPKQDVEVRRTNFNEVALGYTPEDAIAEAKRCLDCKKPLCSPSCPVEIDIPRFIRQIAQGDFAAGIRTNKREKLLTSHYRASLPSGNPMRKHMCPCQTCAPVAIGRLERFLADWEAQQPTPLIIQNGSQPTRKSLLLAVDLQV